MSWMSSLLAHVRLHAKERKERVGDEAGFSTAELLGNAALGIIALVAIWTLLQALGVDIVTWIRAQLLGG